VNAQKTILAVLGVAILIGFVLKRHSISTDRRRVLILSFGGIALYDHTIDECLKCAQRLGFEAEVMTAPSNGDKGLVDQVCNAALQKGADCVVCVGRTFAQIWGNVLRKRAIIIPTVFFGVQDPVEFGLVESLARPGGCLTGVLMGQCSAEVPSRLMHLIMPKISKVLVPYYTIQAVPGVDLQRAETVAYFAARGVSVKFVGIDSHADALKRVEVSLPGEELVITLEGDHINDACAPGMVRLTERHGVAYCSRQMECIGAGAPFVFCFETRFLAEAAFDLVWGILLEGKNPAVTPLTVLDNCREFIVNQTAAKQLDISIDEKALLEAIAADPVLACMKGRIRFVSKGEHEKM